MDRYEADWNIVKRGWDAMVHGTIDGSIVKELGTNGYTGMSEVKRSEKTGARR